MTKIEIIEKQIQELSAEELEQFRQWFTEFDSELWDQQIDSDAKSGKLDALAERALKQHSSGKTSKL
jgi:succinate dehydrogenase flavin-adding protein (antitoxin of CptAB toxin-antitoxin module)